MQIAVITLFPELIQPLMHYTITSRATAGAMQLSFFNPRDFTSDPHQTVDDRPFGGGPGMVMKIEPLAQAIQAAKQVVGANAQVVYLSPQGQPLQQKWLVKQAAQETALVLLAGRYEGIDQRLLEQEVDYELSIGDYVLSGGEIPAMAVIDGLARLLPGVLGDSKSAAQDSFSGELLDHPHYTRPADYEGRTVPDVLLSGDHQAIASWRQARSEEATQLKRPDLWRCHQKN